MYFSPRAYKHAFGKDIEPQMENIKTSKNKSISIGINSVKGKLGNETTFNETINYKTALEQAAKQANRKWIPLNEANIDDLVRFTSNYTEASGLPILNMYEPDISYREPDFAEQERRDLIQSLRTTGNKVIPEKFWFYLATFKDITYKSKLLNKNYNLPIIAFGSLDNHEHYNKYSLERKTHNNPGYENFGEIYTNDYPSDPGNLIRILKDIDGIPRDGYDLQVISSSGNATKTEQAVDIAGRIFGDENTSYKPNLDSRVGYFKGATKVWGIVSHKDEHGLVLRPIYVWETGMK